MVPLVGVMFGNILGSIATFFAYQYQLVQNMSAWLQGNFSTVMKGNYEWLFLMIPLWFVIYLFAYHSLSLVWVKHLQIVLASITSEFSF